jgi:hypothetical protein
VDLPKQTRIRPLALKRAPDDLGYGTLALSKVAIRPSVDVIGPKLGLPELTDIG